MRAALLHRVNPKPLILLLTSISRMGAIGATLICLLLSSTSARAQSIQRSNVTPLSTWHVVHTFNVLTGVAFDGACSRSSDVDLCFARGHSGELITSLTVREILDEQQLPWLRVDANRVVDVEVIQLSRRLGLSESYTIHGHQAVWRAQVPRMPGGNIATDTTGLLYQLHVGTEVSVRYVRSVDHVQRDVIFPLRGLSDALVAIGLPRAR
jgi:hypothetical protein